MVCLNSEGKNPKNIDCVDSGTEGEGNWQKGSQFACVLTPLLLANDTHIQTEFAWILHLWKNGIKLKLCFHLGWGWFYFCTLHRSLGENQWICCLWHQFACLKQNEEEKGRVQLRIPRSPRWAIFPWGETHRWVTNREAPGPSSGTWCLWEAQTQVLCVGHCQEEQATLESPSSWAQPGNRSRWPNSGHHGIPCPASRWALQRNSFHAQELAIYHQRGKCTHIRIKVGNWDRSVRWGENMPNAGYG